MKNRLRLTSVTEAAEQGDATAQFKLGTYYYKGKAVAEDSVEAYKWHFLAGAYGHEQAAAVRSRVVTKMTPEQINEAQGRVRTWLKKAQSRPQRNDRLFMTQMNWSNLC